MLSYLEKDDLVAAAELIRSHKSIAVVLPCARHRPYGASRTHNRLRSHKSIAVVLPCARHRPYGASRTHNRLWQELAYLDLERHLVHEIVITSIGVIPQELWEHPAVLRYDAGVPDIYRLLRLSRAYFAHNPYERVIDCLDFAPYSDILSILVKEKLIARLESTPPG